MQLVVCEMQLQLVKEFYKTEQAAGNSGQGIQGQELPETSGGPITQPPLRLKAKARVIISPLSRLLSPGGSAIMGDKRVREAQEVDGSYLRSRVASGSIEVMRREMLDHCATLQEKKKRRKEDKEHGLTVQAGTVESELNRKELELEPAGQRAQQALLQAEHEWICCMKRYCDLIWERPDLKE